MYLRRTWASGCNEPSCHRGRRPSCHRPPPRSRRIAPERRNAVHVAHGSFRQLPSIQHLKKKSQREHKSRNKDDKHKSDHGKKRVIKFKLEVEYKSSVDAETSRKKERRLIASFLLDLLAITNGTQTEQMHTTHASFLCVFCYCSHFCILFFETWHQQTAGKVWSASVVSAGQTTHIASQIKTLEPGQTLTLGPLWLPAVWPTVQSRLEQVKARSMKLKDTV